MSLQIQSPLNTKPLILQFTAPFYNDTDGTTFYIRLRQHHHKVYFADGLNHFRKDLAIYESVTITFLACKNKSTFDLYFIPDLQHQSCRRSLLFSRYYIWTIQITQSMLGAPGPLVTITTYSKILIQIVAYI
ncbi:hypothetical protein GmHk_03G007589 [Glycine max]|nr:hypothetical protein GmHk_03G007589 [Glycine max]